MGITTLLGLSNDHKLFHNKQLKTRKIQISQLLRTVGLGGGLFCAFYANLINGIFLTNAK